MELSLYSSDTGMLVGTISVSDQVFDSTYNEPLVHQVITAYLARARSGTKAQKSRSQVSGGGAKPWRQKGTGRGGAGSTRSPLWRKGGVSFAAIPRDYSQKVNRKMYRGALKSILSELVRQGRLMIVEAFTLESLKTKALVAKLENFGLRNLLTLIVTDELEEKLYLAARNLQEVAVRQVQAIDPVSLIEFDKVVFTRGAVQQLEEMLA